jgi:hypothetical protein
MAQQAKDSVDAGVQQMKDDWVQRRLEEEKQVCGTCRRERTCKDCVCKVSRDICRHFRDETSACLAERLLASLCFPSSSLN